MEIYLLGEGHGAHDLRKICLDRGVTVLGYVDPEGRPAFRAQQPSLRLEEVALRAFDLVVIANPQQAACHQRLLDLGVPAQRILLFYQDPAAALERLGPIRAFSARCPGTTDTYAVMPLQGKFTADTRTGVFGPREAELAASILRMYRACQRVLETQDPIFKVGENWGAFLKSTRGPLYEALEAGDLAGIDALLANFWRNGLGEGIIAGAEAYRAFCTVPDPALHQTIHPYLRALTQSLGEVFDPADLELPSIGNPFGMLLDGHLIQENSAMNHYRAAFLSGLIQDRPRPVMAEIGGGVGFLASMMLRRNPNLTYLDFDLPETLMVEAYYLSKCFPDRRIHLFDGSIETLDEAALEAWDVLLVPTCLLPRLKPGTVDLFVNTISFGEMSLPIVANYLREIDRTTRGFFYHENLCDLNYDFENYASDFFRIPEAFKKVFTAPSRWPIFGPGSPHHAFTENLYIKRGQVF